jgi:hypothetical protein
MSHPATPTECPVCHNHLVVVSPVWEDGSPTGREVAECRSCGPVETAGEDTDTPPPAARKTASKK